MGLAPCALGSVSIEATARAFGTDWRSEPSVGQFIVGRDPGLGPRHPAGWRAANDASWTERAQAHLRRSGPPP
jgi:hypothetical protein